MIKIVEAPLKGHPDKVCDALVEAVVDEYLRQDPHSSLDIQSLATNGMIVIGGIVESTADFDVAAIARETYASIGYTDTPAFFVNVERPGYGGKVERGAGGTTIVYGYATRETREMLPLACVLANGLAKRVDDLREHDPRFAWLRPDGKVHIGIEDGKIALVVMLIEHDAAVDAAQVKALLYEHAIVPILGLCEGAKILINPSKAFTSGGLSLNAGVSGRKVSSDLYGGLLPHGGASLVGKDGAKPVRAGTYLARAAAKKILREHEDIQAALVQVVYAVGMREPIALRATSSRSEDISQFLPKEEEFSCDAIVKRFNLQCSMYKDIVNYGMFTRDNVPWEQETDL
jgi:S-adenosylmethionine synthetase